MDIRPRALRAVMQVPATSNEEAYLENRRAEALKLVNTQKRAAGGEYRAQVWEFVLDLLRSARLY